MIRDSKSSHAYAKTADLLRQLAQPLQDRFAVVVRKNEPDPVIAVTWPSPMPQVACVFWLRPGAAQAPLDAFAAMLSQSKLFAKVVRMEVTAGQSVLEFCNPLIPGTGEVALCVGPRWFVVSNSGPLIKDLLLGGKRAFQKVSKC
jgi:hypothetical protein